MSSTETEALPCTSLFWSILLPSLRSFSARHGSSSMAFLRFMGDDNHARTYTYSLEVGANGRKLIWEGTPLSIRDSHRKVRDSHDGLILFFSGANRKEMKLKVKGRLWTPSNISHTTDAESGCSSTPTLSIYYNSKRHRICTNEHPLEISLNIIFIFQNKPPVFIVFQNTTLRYRN